MRPARGTRPQCRAASSEVSPCLACGVMRNLHGGVLSLADRRCAHARGSCVVPLDGLPEPHRGRMVCAPLCLLVRFRRHSAQGRGRSGDPCASSPSGYAVFAVGVMRNTASKGRGAGSSVSGGKTGSSTDMPPKRKIVADDGFVDGEAPSAADQKRARAGKWKCSRCSAVWDDRLCDHWGVTSSRGLGGLWRCNLSHLCVCVLFVSFLFYLLGSSRCVYP